MDVVLRGHGWIGLAPHVYDRELGRMSTVIDLSTMGARGPVVDLELRQIKPSTLEVQRAIAAEYTSFEEYAGLALWMDVTREWHGPDAEGY
jgi:hypothetical protein